MKSSWWPAIVACALQFLVVVNITILNVGIIDFERHLDLSVHQIQWLIGGYTVAFALTLVPAGRLGDVAGRRRMTTIGLAVFIIGCVLAGFAQSGTMAILGRVVQGCAAGIINPQALGILQTHYAGKARGSVFAAFGATIGVATAAGPIMGGLVHAAAGPDLGWRWLFWINAPIALAIMCAVFKLPRSSPRTSRIHLDPVGLTLVAILVLGVLAPISGIVSGIVGSVAALAVAALSGLALVRWERRYARRGRAPMLDPRIISRRAFAGGLVVGTAYLAGLTGFILCVSMLLQYSFGFSPLRVALMTIPFAIGSMLAAILGGRAVSSYGRTIVMVGSVVVLASLLATGAVTVSLGGSTFVIGLAICQFGCGIGGGLILAPNQSLTLAEVPVELAGSAGGMLQVGQRFGATVGTSASTVLFLSGVREWNLRDEDAFVMCVGLAVAFVTIALLANFCERRDGRASMSISQ